MKKKQIQPEPRLSPPHLARIQSELCFTAKATKRELKSEDLMCSRPLTGKERQKLLELLEPDQDDMTRCAASHAIAELGMMEALPRLKNMLEKGIPSPHVQDAFTFAVMGIEDMAAHSETPHDHEHLSIMIRMRNSHETIVRVFAEHVLEKADIKHGTIPGWTQAGWVSEQTFRDEPES